MIIKQTNRNYNRTLNEIFNSFPATWGSDTRMETTLPPVNILESAGGYTIEINAPGRSKEDFKIALEKTILTISYERPNAGANNDIKVIKREFSNKDFKRSFSVDEKIDIEAIEARYENGILYLTLPKKAEIKDTPKKIEIQ